MDAPKSGISLMFEIYKFLNSFCSEIIPFRAALNDCSVIFMSMSISQYPHTFLWQMLQCVCVSTKCESVHNLPQ